MKEDTQRIIKGLQNACGQSLFNGIVKSPDDAGIGSLSYHLLAGTNLPCIRQDFHRHVSKRQCREEKISTIKIKSWSSILAEASLFLPSMTSHEHGQVSRLVSILLMGFFLPHSTGNDFFSSQNLSTQPRSASSRQQPHQQNRRSSVFQTEENGNEAKNITEYIISMPLEERLESISHRYGNEFGELDDLILHEHLENAFQLFLKIGLRSFLLGRPAHGTQVDLIHILAMAIHPRPSQHCIRQTTSRLEDKKSDVWEMTTRLMSSLVPNSFNINYTHRVELVKIVFDCLVIPEYQEDSGICKNAPLFEGAIPHLRASLYAFGMASISPFDSHLAQRAMVSLAIQSGIDHAVKEEWSRLLHRLVDDKTNYNNCSAIDTNSGQASNFNTVLLATNSLPSDETFCPHTSRGILLRDFLIRYNEARYFADEDFLQYALSSLTDAIEMQVDCWTKEDYASEKDGSGQRKEHDHSRDVDGNEAIYSNQSPLVLASLLNAAKNIFHFLLPIKNAQLVVKESDSEDEEAEDLHDSHYRDMLISCGIQLVHHWDPIIVKEACTMLVLAFSYTEDTWEDYVGAVFDSVVIAVDIAIEGNVDQGISVISIEGLVSAFSQHSLTFAVNLFQLLLKHKSTKKNPVVIFRLIAAISNARPAVANKYMSELLKHLHGIKDPNVNKHILASILSCRKTYFFANKKDSLTNLQPLILNLSLGNWDRYILSRHALITGNFNVAKDLYNELMNSASSEQSFIWLSAMEMIADGEGRLCSHGAMALPESISKLRMAIGSFCSLQALKQSPTSFQIKLLEFRVCFLDLMTNMRQHTIEMRLIGAEPKKSTRPNLHMKNIVKLLFKLGMDYIRLYKQHGLFICQQSRSVLRTLATLCSFLARAFGQVFYDTISVNVDRDHEVFADGDIAQPTTLLLKKLDSFALEKMNQFVDPKIRAATLLQILDGVLSLPVPIPRSLTCPKALPCASIRLVHDHDTHESDGNRLEICPSASVVYLVSGEVPASLISHSRIPFNTILLWCTFHSRGGSTKLSISSEKSKKTGGGPTATSMSSSRSFFVKVNIQAPLDEGWYNLNIRLGCRDIRGGEWELPFKHDSQHFAVKILRSASK